MQEPTKSLSNDLRQAAEQLAHWRRSKTGRSRIPEELWQLACHVAKTHGVSRTALVLKLDYYSLKRRLASNSSMPRSRCVKRTGRRRSGAAFVELPALSVPGTTECDLEFENGHGARLALRWKGVGSPDLTTLGQVFWKR